MIDSPIPAAGPMRAKMIFAWASVALLFISLVVPVVQAPIVGTINVFGFQDGSAYWLLGFAIIAGVATSLSLYRLLILPGFLVICVTLYYVYHLDATKAELLKGLEGNMFSGLATGLAATVQLQWGIALLIVSGAALIVAGIMRHDARTIAQLLAANRIQFIEGAVGVAVLFFAIAILPALLPRASASAATPSTSTLGDSATATAAPDTTPQPDPKVIEMRRSVSVGITEKGFHQADPENGDFDDDFAVTTQYHNLTGKMITGVKGTLSFYDQFGSRIQGFDIEYDKDLSPGAIVVVPELYKYNQFEDSDTKLRSIPLSRLKVVWEPEQVNFADGSTITAATQ